MLQGLSYIENNVIGLIILSIIFASMRSKHKRPKCDERLFLLFITSTSLIMVLNIIINIMDGKNGYMLRGTNIFLTTIYLILNPVPYLAWSLYVDFYIHRSIKRLKEITPTLMLPAVLSFILCILSIYNKGVFYIDDNNTYKRGHLFIINASLYYSYFIYTYIKIIRNRKNVRKKDYYSLLVFAIPPVTAGLLQTKYFGKSFIWLGVSISALIIFINIQNNEINKDYLTGLYNRRQLDAYLKNCLRELRIDELILMIMMDINFFKDINDTYGHIEGDEALRHTAEILGESFRCDDFISRYAGDEFVVIIKLDNKEQTPVIIDRLRKKFEEFNKSDVTPYDITVSVGYDIYNPKLNMSDDEFIRHTDKLMYEDKTRIKMEVQL